MSLARSHVEALRAYSRNERWGTCSGCPRDSEGHFYPEFCEFTARYDHQLTLDALAEQIQRFQRAMAPPRPESARPQVELLTCLQHNRPVAFCSLCKAEGRA